MAKARGRGAAPRQSHQRGALHPASLTRRHRPPPLLDALVSAGWAATGALQTLHRLPALQKRPRMEPQHWGACRKHAPASLSLVSGAMVLS